MKGAELVLSVVIAVCAMSWATQASHSPQSAPTQANLDESDIDRLEKELADPVTRLAAIAALADFGARKLYEEKRLANWAAEGLEKIAKIWLERDSAKTR